MNSAKTLGGIMEAQARLIHAAETRVVLADDLQNDFNVIVNIVKAAKTPAVLSDEAIATYVCLNGQPLPGDTIEEKRAYVKQLLSEAVKKMLGAFGDTHSNPIVVDLRPSTAECLSQLKNCLP